MRAMSDCSREPDKASRRSRSTRTTCWWRAMMRVFSVVMRRASATTPLSAMPAEPKATRRARAASSAPVTPKGVTLAPSDARFAATLPAPPRQAVSETKSTTGTAASGESRVACPRRSGRASGRRPRRCAGRAGGGPAVRVWVRESCGRDGRSGAARQCSEEASVPDSERASSLIMTGKPSRMG